MSDHPLKRLIQIFIKKEYPFIVDNYPLSVDYDGIELHMDLTLVIPKEFLEENLTGSCDLEGVDFCRGFFMDLDQFQNCFKIKINKEEITKIVSLSYSLFSSQTPHLYRINVNIITNC